MSTLSFPHRASPKSRLRYYDLRRVDDRKATGPKLIIRNATQISSGYVFRATLRRARDAFPLDVICKIIYDDFNQTTRQEGRLYKRLEECQGDTVPQCYGAFEGNIGRRLVSCLVLEYCGPSLEDKEQVLADTSWAFKADVLDCLRDIHEHGVEHNDINESNIVVRPDGRACIIDFDCASKHRCPAGMDMDFHFHDWEPSMCDVECKELYTVAHRMAIWIPWKIEYLGWQILDVRVVDTPEKLATFAPEWVSSKTAISRAREEFEQRQKFLDWRSSLPEE